MPVLSLLLACTTPDPTPAPTAPATDEPTGADTAPTAETGAPTETTTPIDCTLALPTGPLEVTTLDIQTEEDFDFDRDGHLIAQNDRSLVGYSYDGQVEVIAPDIGLDAAGIRALVTGNFVSAQPATGVVKRIDGETGGVSTALSGLLFPNGLESDHNGLVYVAEFLFNGGLRVFDPEGDWQQILINGAPINAVALSPDDNVVYVSSHTYGGGAFDGIVALDRDLGTGEWGTTLRPIIETGSLMQGLATDLCGNLYAVDSETGSVYRYNLADGSVDKLAELAGGGYSFFSSARFSPGFGGFSTTALYVTDRSQIYVMEVGISGRHVLSP